MSPRTRRINAVLKMMRELRKRENKAQCDFCGRKEERLSYPLSSFHIVSRSRCPNLTLLYENHLLACWVPNIYYAKFCHNAWHRSHDSAWSEERKEFIKKRIGEIFKTSYENHVLNLKAISFMLPPLRMARIEQYEVMYKRHLEGR